MLNVHRLAVLRAVVTEGSITGAAGALSYTPSAVSQHITALERETGAQLLERVGRSVRPTAAGALLAGHAEEILDRVAETEAALAALTAGRAGSIGIAGFASAGTGLVPPAVARFRELHPQVELNITLAEHPEAVAGLKSGRWDLAVVILDSEETGAPPRAVPAEAGLEWQPLLLDPYFLALPAGHPLTAQTEVEFSVLADERLVGGDRNRTCPCGELFRQACARVGFQPDFAIEVDDYPTVQSLVAVGLGVATIPLLGLSPAVHDGVVVRPLVRPGLARRIYAVTRASGGEDPLVPAMLRSLRAAADALLVPQHLPASARTAHVAARVAA